MKEMSATSLRLIPFGEDCLCWRYSTIPCESGSDGLPRLTLRASSNTVLEMVGAQPHDPSLQ